MARVVALSRCVPLLSVLVACADGSSLSPFSPHFFTPTLPAPTAYKASDYLDALLKRGAIQPSASPQLDAVYAKYRPPPTRLDGEHSSSPSPSASSSPPSTPSSSPSASPSAAPSASASAPPSSSELLLTRDAVPALQEALARELESAEESEGFAVGMYRALEQARARVEKRCRGHGAEA